MLKSYMYRLFPTKAQISHLDETRALCCELYNAGLQERVGAWRLERKSIQYLDQQNQLPELKASRPEMNGVHSQVLQDALRRLDNTFQAFFLRVKAGERPGFPRFRSYARYGSFTYTQSGFSLHEDGKLMLSKIGKVKIKLHRPVEGKIRTLTITRKSTGKWFACFSVEVETEPLCANEKAIGVDLGLTHFATLSSGEQIPNPRFFRSDENALAKAQRKGKRKAVRRIHERIASRRRNFAHQLSRALVSRFGFIALEELNVKGMMRNHRLSKSIQDAAWPQFARFTLYKAESAGRAVRLVDPRNTSKRCSVCGVLVEKSLADRVHHCSCGVSLDRDHNAALNILALGLQSLESSNSKKPRCSGRGVATRLFSAKGQSHEALRSIF